MTKVSYDQMTGHYGLLAKRKPFIGNSLSAEWTTMRPASGLLSESEFNQLEMDWRDSLDACKPMYVVYSYSTPVAWAIEGKPAHCVEQKFSVTTSKGQTYVRAWINAGVQDTVSY